MMATSSTLIILQGYLSMKKDAMNKKNFNVLNTYFESSNFTWFMSFNAEENNSH